MTVAFNYPFVQVGPAQPKDHSGSLCGAVLIASRLCSPARCVRLGVRLLKHNDGELKAEDVVGTRFDGRVELDDLIVPISRVALRRSATLEAGTDPAEDSDAARRG